MPRFNQQRPKQPATTPRRYNHIEVIKEERRDPTLTQVNHQYNQQGLTYANQLFNKTIHKLIWAMSREAYNKTALSFLKRYPVIRMLTFLSKKLFLNGLELVFMQYILEENKWDIEDESIVKSASGLRDFMNSTDVGNEKEYRCFLLYLTLIAYSAKYYLNDTERIEMFGKELNVIIPDFQSIFKEWSKRNSAVTSKISPKILNSIFRKLNSKDDKINYLMMVEEIIHISPPYNNNQNDKKAKNKRGTHVETAAMTRAVKESVSESRHEQERLEANIQEEELQQLQEQPPLYRQGTSMDGLNGLNDMIDRNLP